MYYIQLYMMMALRSIFKDLNMASSPVVTGRLSGVGVCV